MKWLALFVMLLLPLSFARGQDEYYREDQSESLVVEDSFGNSLQLSFDDVSIASSADFGSGLLEFDGTGSVDAGFSGWAGSSLLSGDGIYRGSGKAAKNLTPSKKDLAKNEASIGLPRELVEQIGNYERGSRDDAHEAQISAFRPP